MDGLFPASLTHANLPLRKPTSSFKASGGSMAAPVVRDALTMSTSGLRTLSVNICNFCGKQGVFCCERCRKVDYCSASCQSQDWKAHRHLCNPNNPTTQMERSKEAFANTKDASLGVGSTASLMGQKNDDTSTVKRMFMKDLPASTIVREEEIQGTVVEFYDPGKFFFLPQSPEILKALQNISVELQKTYWGSSATDYDPCVGEICAVQFSCDLNWYRGLVQGFSTQQKTSNILYIDFGNEEDVPVNRIRPLAANSPMLAPCVMQCRIAKVVPMLDQWPEQCCVGIKKLLCGKAITVKVADAPLNGHVYDVDIPLSVGKQLSTYLLENDYAQQVTATAARSQQDTDPTSNVATHSVPSSPNGKDENNWAQPPESLSQAVGDHLSVVVTFFQSPSHFNVQNVMNAGVIQDLQLKLKEHCTRVAAPQNFRPAPGTVCCAQFTEDNQWYRCKILAYTSENRVCVHYIDFGNSEEVDVKNLSPISPSLLSLPIQAVPCGLAGVKPFGGSWSNACVLAMQQKVSNRILRIKIQGAHEGKALVSMVDEACDPQANFSECLVSAGYAVPATDMPQNDQNAAEEPLIWTTAELPSDNQTVVLQALVVENPGKFYCCLCNPTAEEKRAELAAQLKLHCETDASPYMAMIGEPCCVVLPSNGTYRAMVHKLSEDKVTVSLVDYGYCLTVEASFLRCITPQLLKLPFQAVRCWLAGVEHLGSEWSQEALLRFHALLNVGQLTARVISVNEQGYGVDLESRGQNMAAALISEQLTKDLKEMAIEAQNNLCQAAKPVQCMKTESHVQVQATCGERSTQEQSAASTAGPSFTFDWNTVELPLNKPFQPVIAAYVNPALFYLLCVNQAEEKLLQQVMMDVAAYCTSNGPALSPATNNRPPAGAACCAQFSDNIWRRAVVLEVGENGVRVLDADRGSSETVPLSRVMPIPVRLLKLPFHITRCTLSGEECLSAPGPDVVLQRLTSGVLVTVQSFDGRANVLSIGLPAENGGTQCSAVTRDALNAHANRNPQPDAAPKRDKQEEETRQMTAEAAVNDPKEKTEQQTELPTKVLLNPSENSCGPHTTGCCCLSLKQKMDHLEQVLDLHLTLINKLVGQIGNH